MHVNTLLMKAGNKTGGGGGVDYNVKSRLRLREGGLGLVSC